MRPTRVPRPPVPLLVRLLVALGLVAAGLVLVPSASATGTAETATLVVWSNGDGIGTITSSPAGIDCGDGSVECAAEFPPGTEVTLTATPDAISTFSGWDGDCAGTDPCVLTMDADADVIATFDANVLEVVPGGDGDGRVTSSPAGVDCGEDGFDCAVPFAAGTVVTLTAVSDPTSVFLGWDGACSGTGTCVVTVDADTEVVATFDTAWLDVDVVGDGDGDVTSLPGGIDCEASTITCRAAYLPGTTVTLSVAADDLSVFERWGGRCSDTQATCQVTLDTDATVTARLDSSWVVVDTTGDGTGAVTSDEGEISCPSACVGRFRPGTELTLTATHAATTVFDGWSGDACGSAGATCTTVLDDDLTVIAAFDTGLVEVTSAGDGSGQVTSQPVGISCGRDCTEAYLPGTPVTLTADPAAHSAFLGWAGDCSGTGTCVVDAGDDPQVTARFDTSRLWISRSGTGAGVVTSDPAGLDCGDDCTERFRPGSTVTLTATPQGGGTFAGWSGGGCSGTGPCELVVGDDLTIDAIFMLAAGTEKIAYECGGDICVMNPDGSEQTNITNTPDANEFSPTVSSSGTRVAFSSNAELEDNADRNFEIASMDVDGSDVQQLTFTDGSMFEVWHNNEPAWSPDDSKIAFHAERRQYGYVSQIYVINADGTDETMITSPAGGVSHLSPQWSPDGTKIAYTRWLGATDAWVMDADGTNHADLTPPEMRDSRDPAWSPDGAWVAFAHDVSFHTDISMIRTDGTGLTTVTDHWSVEESPTFSPDGEWIAYSSSRAGGYDIWAIETPPVGGYPDGVAAPEPRQLTDRPGAELTPYWDGGGDGTELMAVTVRKTGKGKGSVSSAPGGIACGRDCTEAYVDGTRVWLTATPAPGSRLASWSVGCTGSRSCQVDVDRPRTIKVRFDRTPSIASRPGLAS